MKDFTHAVVQTIGEDGRARSVLLDIETASQLTNAKVSQLVAAGSSIENIPPEVQQILSWDLAGMKRALVEGEKRGEISADSSMEQIEKYLKDYQQRHKVDFGLPKLT
ncbi:MAG: hypothetical protein KTR25_14965 [Myxococcales bacterium]|nr:hypothetical protein [Myxococcales bacterium]